MTTTKESPMFQIADGRRVEVQISEAEAYSDVVIVHPDGRESVFAHYSGTSEATQAIARGKAANLAHRLNLG